MFGSKNSQVDEGVFSTASPAMIIEVWLEDCPGHDHDEDVFGMVYPAMIKWVW